MNEEDVTDATDRAAAEVRALHLLPDAENDGLWPCPITCGNTQW
ncbi:hypothetical protein M878_44185 [Streptomyces roseochromogenus subsp. oscitans DS 12.976]|uniref:Uncharacterized protein n=1 Tax=Streptomyces roseochromogenus subsp. oscitans DS 12.976 TaxID=1352936 RepID=V6JGT2_STRRC|nr:hypothetical protein M878_44185 [Streptomyces roseochromogenus subsp. oscitans DS 12.976]